MTDKMQEARTHLDHLSEMFRIVWSAGRTWTLAWAVLLVVQGLLPAATVYLSRLLVDGVVAVLDHGLDPTTARPVITYGILMAASLLLIEVIQSLLTWIRAVQSELVQDHISSLVHQRAVKLDIAHY
ncbi:MAG: ABC transporter ATP-binding protein, partial [Chloroflexi bacterium]|nr:ABC transporter ATP-binding protein [Chloroflexota bacterium]